MRGILTLILVTVLGTLAGYVYLTDFKDPEKRADPSAVLPFHVDDVLEIDFYGDQRIRFLYEPEKSEWRVEEPVADEADSATVISFLNALKGMRPSHTVLEPGSGEPADPEKYGFRPENRKILLRMAGKDDPVELVYGMEVPLSDDVYVKIFREGETGIYTVAKTAFRYFEKSSWDWRQKRVAPFLSSEAVSLRVKHAKGPEVRLEKSKEKTRFNSWEILSPREIPADDGVVESYLSNLSYLNASGMIHEDASSPEARRKLASGPDYEVVVGLEGGREVRLGFYGDSGKGGKSKEALVVSSMRKGVFQITTLDLQRMKKEDQDLRDRRILAHAERDGVSRLGLRFPSSARSLVLVKMEGQWRPEDQDSEGIFRERVLVELLDTLNESKAEAFVKRIAGDVERILELELLAGIKNENLPLRLELFRQGSGESASWYGKRTDATDYYLLPARVGRKVPSEERAFFEKNEPAE